VSTPSPALRRLEGPLRAVGAPFVQLGRQLAAIASVFVQVLVALARGRVRPREAIRQAYLIGNRSVFFITVTLGFLGFISVFQVGTQISRILPDFTMMGPAFIQMMWREFAPTITGLMVATRVGSGIAAEIGSMVVTEQVDALRMCNADPVPYLVVPRTVASVVMIPLLTVYAVLVATVAGMFLAHTAFQVAPSTFLSLQLVTSADVVIGLVKSLAYGFWIPVVAGEAGLSATGGSAGVGWATTRAVVNACFSVVLLDFVISGVGYVAFNL